MIQARVISINPSIKTMGELGGNPSGRLARISRCLTSPGRRTISVFKRTTDLLFGLNGKVNAQLSGKLLFIRSIAGAILLLSAFLPMTVQQVLSMQFDASTLMLGILGICLFMGFMTRAVSYAAAGWYGYILTVSAAAGTLDATAGMLCMLALVFAVLGPGKFSVDQLIRAGIFRIRKNMIKKRRQPKVNTHLQYNAYADLERRMR